MLLLFHLPTTHRPPLTRSLSLSLFFSFFKTTHSLHSPTISSLSIKFSVPFHQKKKKNLCTSQSSIARAHPKLCPRPRAPKPLPPPVATKINTTTTNSGPNPTLKPSQTRFEGYDPNLHSLSWQQQTLHPSFHGSGHSNFGMGFGLIWFFNGFSVGFCFELILCWICDEFLDFLS